MSASEQDVRTRKDRVVGAEGAVSLIERLSPALENVDSSSGAIGTAVNKAIAELLQLLDVDTIWHYKVWGAKALAAMGDKIGAIRYAEACRSPYIGDFNIDEFVRRCCFHRVSSTWLAQGYGYEIASDDVQAAHDATMGAVEKLGIADRTRARIREVVATEKFSERFMIKVLRRQLGSM